MHAASRKTRTVLILIAGALASTASLAAQEADSPHNDRRGLWGGFGFGGAWAGCLASDCDTLAEFGFSGNARLGGTPSQSFRVAAGTFGYYKQVDNVTLQGGVLSGQLMFYPSEGDFFLLFGGGVAVFEVSIGDISVDETSGAAHFGVGYDLPLSRKGTLALTPYANWVITGLEGTVHMLQFGLGLTWN